jgi:hypothetical protein
MLVTNQDEERSKTLLLKIGRLFGLVTPGATSLIVLDDVSQYLRYEIEPPASHATCHQQYHVLLAAKKRKAFNKQRHRWHHAIDWWTRRLDWWSRDWSLTGVKPCMTLHHVPPRHYSEQVRKYLCCVTLC